VNLQSFEDQHITRQERRDEKGSKEASLSGKDSDVSGDSSEAELNDQVQYVQKHALQLL